MNRTLVLRRDLKQAEQDKPADVENLSGFDYSDYLDYDGYGY